MHKLVYLFELDSVRNSAKEIEKGQQALFEEILGHGNYVALTFNQLTDSRAFLSLIDDKKTYDCVLKLFEAGSLRVSRFGSFRTASQYVQSAIEKCLRSDEEIFQFSAAPVLHNDKSLLKKMLDALQNSDPSVLEDKLDERKSIVPASEKESQLKFLIRYIRMILFLSVQSITAIPAKNDNSKQKLSEFINRIIGLYQPQQAEPVPHGFLSVDIRKILSQAVVQLQEIGQTMSQKEDGKKLLENRTNWVDILNSYPGGTTKYMAEAIVDLCYNYTLEDSIQGAAKHYHDPAIPFQTDFENRLTLYWDDFTSGVHKFSTGNSCQVHQKDKLRLPPWDIAVRLINFDRKPLGRWNKSRRPAPEKMNLYYEENFEQEQHAWYRRITRKMALRFGVAVFYLVLFIIVQFIVGQVENAFMQIKLQAVIASIISIVCFGILGSLISNWMSLPDILESVKEVGMTIHDLGRILFRSKDTTYRNTNSSKIESSQKGGNSNRGNS